MENSKKELRNVLILFVVWITSTAIAYYLTAWATNVDSGLIVGLAVGAVATRIVFEKYFKNS